MEEKTLLNATICFLKKENQILLVLKTKKIGMGRWNGYGGGIEHNENAKIAAVRELKEETGEEEPGDDKGIIALPENLEKIAVVDFHNTKSGGDTFICQCHFYLVHKWTGELKETDTMIKPTWFDVKHLPYEQMMPADIDYLPIVLNGQKLKAKAYLGPFQKEKLKDTEIEIVQLFEDD